MCLVGEVQGLQVKLPRKDQNKARITLSEDERAAVEKLELPSWARRVALALEPSDGESVLTMSVLTLIRAARAAAAKAWVDGFIDSGLLRSVTNSWRSWS